MDVEISTNTCYTGPGAASNGRRLAPALGAILCPHFTLVKGGLLMVTYADLFTYSLVIIGIVGLVLGANKKK